MNFLLFVIILFGVIIIHSLIKQIEEYKKVILNYDEKIINLLKPKEQDLEKDLINFLNTDKDIYSDIFITNPSTNFLSPYNYTSPYTDINLITKD